MKSHILILAVGTCLVAGVPAHAAAAGAGEHDAQGAHMLAATEHNLQSTPAGLAAAQGPNFTGKVTALVTDTDVKYIIVLRGSESDTFYLAPTTAFESEGQASSDLSAIVIGQMVRVTYDEGTMKAR